LGQAWRDDFQGSFLQRSRPAQPQLARKLVAFVILELQLHPFEDWDTPKSGNLTWRQSDAPQPYGMIS
jgi:hypothetical protein